MKTTFVSSYAVSDAMRQNLARMQQELTKLQTEVVTGKVSDPGLALGSSTGKAVSLSRDADRLQGIIDSNGVVSSRLQATQAGLEQISGVADSLISSLTAALSGQAQPSVTGAAAESALKTITGILNTSLNGEYLFAGVNTDVKPIGDYEAGSAAKTAFDNAFSAYFGFSKTDPAAAGITATQMDDFLTTAVEPQFLGAGWDANWSSATDEAITSRITLGETADTSVSANESGMRKFAMAATIVSEFSDSALGQGALASVYNRASSLAGAAASEVSQVQARTGIVEQRVTKASERLSMQVDIFTGKLSKMEGIDPYEASTHISSLLSQIETAYTLTSRIQQLSLVNYLK